MQDAQRAWLGGDVKTAQRIVDDALTRFSGSDADAVWSLRVLRGNIVNSTSTCTAATRYVDALRLPQRLAKKRVAVDRLIALGLAQSRCNDTNGARLAFANAEKIARDLDADAESAVLVRKADFEIATRAWDLAEQDIRSLLALSSKRSLPRFAARGWAALGKLRGQQERYDEAVEANLRSLSIADAAHDTPLVLLVRLNLGWLYTASGDYDRGIEMLNAADAEYARLGRKNDRVVALMQLGNAYLNQRRYGEARQYYEQGLALATELDSPTRGYLLDNLARVAFAANDYGRAETLNEQALQFHRARNESDATMRCLVTKARIAEKVGNADGAEPLYKTVIRDAKSRLPRMEAYRFLAEYHSNHHARVDAEREFRQSLAIYDSARSEMKSEELKLAFATTMDAVVNDLVELLVVDGRAAEALRVTEQHRARTLEEGLGVSTNAAHADFLRVARQNGCILSYWLTPKVSFMWAVTPARVDVFRLPPQADVVAAIDEYQRDIAGPRGTLEMTAARGQRLWSILVAPVASQIAQSKRIAIVADKQLNALNFETIVSPAPRPHYWIEDVTITTAASIDLLARVNRGATQRRSLLLVGDPPQTDASLPPLAWAKSEIQRVRSHFADATVITGQRATPMAYESTATPRYAYVHFVAHGIGSVARPLDSAVVLGRDASGYKLYARDILRRRLDAQLVTISSCHGAGQRAFIGEGLVGLAWAFLRAGAHQVIAALWEVSDSATPDLMDAMYARIARGDDPADALREAKLKLLRSNTIYRRPLYWAPFVLYSGA